jgi:hypothetical protein
VDQRPFLVDDRASYRKSNKRRNQANRLVPPNMVCRPFRSFRESRFFNGPRCLGPLATFGKYRSQLANQIRAQTSAQRNLVDGAQRSGSRLSFGRDSPALHWSGPPAIRVDLVPPWPLRLPRPLLAFLTNYSVEVFVSNAWRLFPKMLGLPH